MVNFTQELMAGFNRIKWQLLQELVAGLIKNIHKILDRAKLRTFLLNLYTILYYFFLIQNTYHYNVNI